MKILFICGSLEPGRDGVGDYTRRLAGELIQQGYEIALLALHDFSANEIVQEFQQSEGSKITVVRIPNKMESKIRYAKAKQFVTDFNPEWISLQYVPFSFQEKGLPFGLAGHLAQISQGRKWHIMFHELWVGMDKESSFKHKIWGNLQQYIAREVIKKTAARKIHTQSRFYQFQLEKIGCKALYLPLFGNIEVIKSEVLAKAKDTLSFIIFGTIHPNAPVKEFISELSKYGQNANLKVELNFIGRCGSELDHWQAVCKDQNIDFNILGEQDAATISKVLQNADWGISTTPWRQIEKSGTVAAMLEHGLDVICVARPWTPNGKIPSVNLNGISEYKENQLASMLNIFKSNNSKVGLKKIADSFIEALDYK
ncbi:glycosyltransferase [Flavobacterium panacagri]|uniref:glycosyltransferase n=1 Tax=Flavobacterium panacagri TaxID=3034146 RepID=UPI0025A563DE|nr:glycosyltransferase [Flavobacterium panacagri]